MTHSTPVTMWRQPPVIMVPPTSTPAQRALTTALQALVDLGGQTPCQAGGGRLWLSEDRAQRQEAARLCSGCPVVELCAAAGQSEWFGVWGGADQTMSTDEQTRVRRREYRARAAQRRAVSAAQ